MPAALAGKQGTPTEAYRFAPEGGRRPLAEAVWDHVFADKDIVAEGSRKVPHDNRVWRAPPCSFPTHKTKN